MEMNRRQIQQRQALRKAPVQQSFEVNGFEVISLISLFRPPAVRQPGKVSVAVPDADKWTANRIHSFEPGKHIDIFWKLTEA